MSSNIEFVNTELNKGFLSGFVEASVEKPADGRNGVGQAKAVVFFIIVVAIGLLQLKLTRDKEVQQ